MHLLDAKVQLVSDEGARVHQLKKAKSGDPRLILAAAAAMADAKAQSGLSTRD